MSDIPKCRAARYVGLLLRYVDFDSMPEDACRIIDYFRHRAELESVDTSMFYIGAVSDYRRFVSEVAALCGKNLFSADELLKEEQPENYIMSTESGDLVFLVPHEKSAD